MGRAVGLQTDVSESCPSSSENEFSREKGLMERFSLCQYRRYRVADFPETGVYITTQIVQHRPKRMSQGASKWAVRHLGIAQRQYFHKFSHFVSALGREDGPLRPSSHRV